jgi:hypothetical protein
MPLGRPPKERFELLKSFLPKAYPLSEADGFGDLLLALDVADEDRIKGQDNPAKAAD